VRASALSAMKATVEFECRRKRSAGSRQLQGFQKQVFAPFDGVITASAT